MILCYKEQYSDDLLTSFGICRSSQNIMLLKKTVKPYPMDTKALSQVIAAKLITKEAFDERLFVKITKAMKVIKPTFWQVVFHIPSRINYAGLLPGA